ncbi:hypothetical protein KAE70_04300 [Bartonella henselae]|uniref:hypothetical protein n=1 Tax=Bartonella henselae TaxID=38323 RepID=UPI0011787F6B|nr:hypothetical protein [Bartonella henselae]UJM32324.1 hypothetical protein KAE70_04300 [Bartonella henselae]
MNFIFHAIIDHILSFQCAESFYIIVVLMIAICCLARLLTRSQAFEVLIELSDLRWNVGVVLTSIF